jgi:hypothetical protein
MWNRVNEMSQTVKSHSQLLHSKSKSLAKLEFQVEQIDNKIEEDELWSQSKANPKEQYMIDEDASTTSHDELI